MMRLVPIIGLLALPFFLATSASATEVARHGEAAVTDADIRAALASVPPAQRDVFRRSEPSARNLALDLAVRKVFAERARNEGILDDPVAVDRLRLIEERALYELYLERAEQAALKPETLEAIAREEYRAFPERFQQAESVHARHILVRFGEDRLAAREKIDAILARLNAGEAFDKLAEQLSDDPGSAARGGDLGYFPRGKMVKAFDEAAFALTEPGQLSAIVETQFGFHILRFEGRRPAGAVPFDEVREALIEAARRKFAGDIRRDLVGPLREDGAIDVDADALRSAIDAQW